MKTIIGLVTAVLLAGCSQSSATKVGPKERLPTKAEFTKYLEKNIQPAGKLTVEEPENVDEPDAKYQVLKFQVEWAYPSFQTNPVFRVSRGMFELSDTVDVHDHTYGHWKFENKKLVNESVFGATSQQWEWLKPRAEMLANVMYGARK